MPELPEVETTKKKLMAARLVDRRIAGIRTDYPKAFKSSFSFQKAAKDITGRKIKKIRRQGKILFIDLAGKPDERILAFHLRMSGSLLVGGKNLKEKGVHFRADLGNGRFLYFRDPRKFGVIWYFSPDEIKNFAYLRNLGQDFLETNFREFKEKLKKYKGQIKPFLLRQDIFSGIGNIISDEALWLAKIHPKTSIARLHGRDISKLYKNLKKVIKAILKQGGTSMRDWSHPDGKSGNYQEKFKIYRRKICPRCRTALARIVVGSRKSSVCPKCQRIRV